MMSHLPGSSMPHGPSPHQSRRQNEYHAYHQHVPYAYHYQPQYHHIPPPQQWYPQYQHYQPPTRHYQPNQGPLIVSSHPHPQPLAPVYRPLPPQNQTPQPVRTPQLERQSTPSAQSNIALSNTPAAIATTVTRPTTPPIQTPNATVVVEPAFPVSRIPFYPKLPWFSVPECDYPPKNPRRRRRRRPAELSLNLLELPARDENQALHNDQGKQIPGIKQEPAARSEQVDAAIADTETPQTSIAPSELASTGPTTPSSLTQNFASAIPPSTTIKRPSNRPVIPALPIKPILPAQNFISHQTKPSNAQQASGDKTPTAEIVHSVAQNISQKSDTGDIEEPIPAASPPIKSWAGLFGKTSSSTPPNASLPIANISLANGLLLSKTGSLADALRQYSTESEIAVSFLEPRGLVNTGNMCYMNSILQILVFCVPFYGFLDGVGKRAVHSFQSETPLVEAMILFMREFSVIDSADSPERLKLRLKDSELEQYGESFIPEYVYEVIKKLPLFSTMRRGHQQDAEEFLGFLLEGLHDECVQVMKTLGAEELASHDITTKVDATNVSNANSTAWLEVGPKQKAAVTRSSGVVSESPITKIFGGYLRSELRVPGLKNSVTLERYQPLQLDIGDPNISNITHALQRLTRSEVIYGEFNSPRGPGTTATKQVLIETLPPVLILHLKRFQYDNMGGTQKIWKKVGYPLELEIPKEVFSQQKRSQYALSPGGLPKYKLIGVVYHHGKSASGGHYTVDVRRQDGDEWIRFDDTVVRRVRSDDVAGEGGEEDPKVLAAALENHKRDQSLGKNIFQGPGFDAEGDEDEEHNRAWSQVSPGATNAPKKAALNGTSTPSTAGKRTPMEQNKSSFKDFQSKAAYILFYKKV